jgi:glycosyltransferase involved in cell wall biosynthesis
LVGRKSNLPETSKPDGAAAIEEATRCAPAGVTIAIPNWNHELVLPRSVGSALAAVRRLRRRDVPADVLVVDDASRDGSLTLLRQLEALHYGDGLRVLSLAKNVGLAAVRNLALVHAEFRYVLFMDADNELIPDNLFQFYRSIQQTGAAAVYGNLLSPKKDAAAVGVMSNESFQDKIFRANYIDAFALFDREQLLDAGGYDSLLPGREDWELYLHLATSGRRIVFVPLVMGVYHDLPISMIKEASGNYIDQTARCRRVFDQLGLRDRMPLNTRHLRFHPDVGYL